MVTFSSTLDYPIPALVVAKARQQARAIAQDWVTPAVLLATFALCAGSAISADTWWHLATGRWMVANRAVPHADVFSFSATGQSWIAHEYMSDLFMYVLHRIGGFPMLLLANAALLTLSFWLVYRRCRGARWVNACALLLGAWAARPGFSLRPQTMSFLFAALFLYALDRFVRDHRAEWLAVLPPVMLIWVQFHAGFILGLVLILLTLTGEVVDWFAKRGKATPAARQPLAVAFLFCLVMVPLNPNGFVMFRFPFDVMRMQTNRMILEWMPPVLSEARYWPFIALAVLTLLAMLLSKRKYRPSHFLIFMLFALAALVSRRNVPLFSLIAVPLLAEHLRVPDIRKLTSRAPQHVRHAAATTTFAVAVILTIGQTVHAIVDIRRAQHQNFPAAAVEFLRVHQPPHNLLNAYGFGGYLIWTLPEYKVYVDGRADMYGDAFLRDFIDVYQGHAFPDALLERGHIGTVMVEPNSTLARLFRMKTANGSWKLIYEDQQAVIFVRGERALLPVGCGTATVRCTA